MRRSVLIAALLLAGAPPAVSAEKTNLAFAAAVGDAVFFVDTETIRRQGDQATAWVMMFPSKPVPGGTKPALAGAVHRVHDCKARTFRDFADVLYTEDGPGSVQKDQEQAQAAPDGSAAAAVLDLVCFDKRIVQDDWPFYANWRQALQRAQDYFRLQGADR